MVIIPSLKFVDLDVCIIAGIGGKTIVEILNVSKSHKVNQFILQANNNVEKISDWCVCKPLIGNKYHHFLYS